MLPSCNSNNYATSLVKVDILAKYDEIIKIQEKLTGHEMTGRSHWINFTRDFPDGWQNQFNI